MNECKKCKRLIEKALYNELNSEETVFFNSHLGSCSECAHEFEELKSTLTLFKTQTQTDLNENFMNNFWELLEPKLEKKKPLFERLTRFTSSFRFTTTWKYQLTGAVALLITGIFIGKYLNGGNGQEIQNILPGNKTTFVQPAANIEASNYIERSKVLLLGLMNFDPATDDTNAISLAHQREISRDLITQASQLKEGLKNPSQQELKKLVSDIELILLQIANLETKYDLSGIDLIKDGVKTKGIFLKINIQEMKESSKETIPQKNKSEKGNKKI